MIHFFPPFSNDASRSPFARELAASGVEHRLLAFEMRLHYRSRLAMLLIGLPRIFLLATRSAWRSLVKSDAPPDIVVLNSDVEVLVFSAFRALRFSHHPKIALLGFIYTSRRSPIINRLRRAYFQRVLALTDTVICHSRREVRENERLFAAASTRFVYVPLGIHVAGRESVASAPMDPPFVLAAGRSGRDYQTLFDAVRDQDIAVHVVCDSSHALVGLDTPPNVTILRHCYGQDYLNELAAARAIVVPLAVDNISAGQMVLLQAMALAKPVVATRTSTIEEYVTDGVEVLLVSRADVAELRAAILRLLASPHECATIGQRGLQSFDQRFNMRSYVQNVLAAL